MASQAIVERVSIPSDEDGCYTQNIRSMLLVDEYLVVFSAGRCQQDTVVNDGIDYRPPFFFGTFGTVFTRITIYNKEDLSIAGTPQVFRGSYINARAIERDIYVVTSRSLNVDPFLSRFNPWTLTTPEMSANGERLNETDYEALAWEVAEGNVDEFVAELTKDVDCETLQQITLFQNTETVLPYGQVMGSIATITGFNVANPETNSASSRVMPTSSWQFYASETTLVLCAEGYWFDDGVETETYVLAYDLAGAEVKPLGLGIVPGYVLNQFSIDGYNGYLRFATSIRQRWRWIEDGGVWEPQQVDGDNLIVVLRRPTGEASVLEDVGRLEGLGKPGERIYSVRFQGDRAFVVCNLVRSATADELTHPSSFR